jgi:hypothetical protein
MPAVPAYLKHRPGSWARQKYGCDCRDCLPKGEGTPGRPPKGDAALSPRERQARLRAAKKGQPVPPGTKHGIYAFKIYGCRCSTCRAAKVRQNHRVKNPWMYRPLRGRWHEEDGITTLCWPPVGAGPDWTCPHEREEAA